MKNGVLKRLAEERQAREFIDLLLFDRVWRNSNDLAAADKDCSGHLFPYRLEEGYQTQIQRNRQRIAPNRNVAHVEHLRLVEPDFGKLTHDVACIIYFYGGGVLRNN